MLDLKETEPAPIARFVRQSLFDFRRLKFLTLQVFITSEYQLSL